MLFRGPVGVLGLCETGIGEAGRAGKGGVAGSGGVNEFEDDGTGAAD